MGKKVISLFEIYLLVMFSVAFAYLVGETNSLNTQLPVKSEESKFIEKLRNIVLGYLSGGLVSAQAPAVWTCQQNVNGTGCQEYPSDICNSQCTTNCFQGTRNNYAPCQIGTCFDPLLGTCNAGTPRFSCESSGAQWSAQQPAQCNRGCCLINPNGQGGAGEAQYTTTQQCNYLGQTLGSPINWDPAVTNEVACLLRASSQEEGACVLEFMPAEQKYNCDFMTQTACLTAGGNFSTGRLCTDPALNTICERTQQTTCAAGKDEVYYKDSCGNIANIYDSTKLNNVNYWSVVVPKTQSCLLGATGTSLAHQNSCGSCEYLLGSKCGTPRQGVDDTPIYGNYVCRDLSCVDEWDNPRRNGESWCAFDSRIGVDGSGPAQPEPDPAYSEYCNRSSTNLPQANGSIIGNAGSSCLSYQNYGQIFSQRIGGPNSERSVDLPGSRHYKKICLDGEVRTEPCAEYRDEICAESVDANNAFSSAGCRVNTWQQCLAANADQEALDKCEENPDCFLKGIDVDKFEFSICAPQYPPGFDLTYRDDDKSPNTICSFGTHSCTYVEKKKITGWKCIANCDCKTRKFTETMNNLCMSLGDCGGQVNLEGEFSGSYTVKKAPRLGAGYINGLQQYATPIEGQHAVALNISQLAAIFGVPESAFDPSNVYQTFALFGAGAAGLLFASEIGKMLGIAGQTAATTGATTGVGTAAGGSGAAAAGGGGSGAAAAGGTTPAASSAGGSFAGALGGAAVGAAIGYIIGTIFGLDGTALIVLMVVGAVIGALWGAGVLAESGFFAASTLTAAMPYLIVIVIIIIIIMMVLGIGKIRPKTVDFKCLPWQPPAGGSNCEKCGDNGLPCSKYKCQSYGRACRFLNEGTGNETCINVAPNDASPPVINVNPPALSQGFSYVDAQPNIGTKIKQDSVSDGCIKEYTAINWGVLLDEPGQCKFSEEHTQSFEEMEDFFGGTNLYLLNHSMPVAMPSLDELGVGGVDPARRANYNLYVRCQDIAGNSHTAEYIAQFCIAPADDHTAPVITRFVPPSPGLSGLNATTFPLSFYTNEPAECRWSLQDQAYEVMPNIAMCQNEISQITLYGWLCQSTLSVSGNATTNYHFRCADQPWLGTNETNPNYPDPLRNVPNNSTTYQIQKTATPLTITSLTPDNQVISVGSLPASVTLEVRTAGGIHDGNALCSFRLNNAPLGPFLNTGTNVHTQLLNQISDGVYNTEVSCRDVASNTATRTGQFTIQVDSNGPIITHIYSSGASLSVITNEPATCAFSTTNCGFDFTAGTLLSGSSQVHTMPYDNGITYRIKCRDTFGNIGMCFSASGGY